MGLSCFCYKSLAVAFGVLTYKSSLDQHFGYDIAVHFIGLNEQPLSVSFMGLLYSAFSPRSLNYLPYFLYTCLCAAQIAFVNLYIVVLMFDRSVISIAISWGDGDSLLLCPHSFAFGVFTELDAQQ